MTVQYELAAITTKIQNHSKRKAAGARASKPDSDSVCRKLLRSRTAPCLGQLLGWQRTASASDAWLCADFSIAYEDYNTARAPRAADSSRVSSLQ